MSLSTYSSIQMALSELQSQCGMVGLLTEEAEISEEDLCRCGADACTASLLASFWLCSTAHHLSSADSYRVTNWAADHLYSIRYGV